MTSIQQIDTEINQLQSSCDGTKGCPDDPFCGSINFSACGRITVLKSARIQEGRKLAQTKKAQTKKAQELQEITFNEQINSGDFNETPITDVNVNSVCSECTEPEHQMPDGSMMKDSEMEKKPLNNNMIIVGIAAAGVIGLLLYTKGGLK